ncbi:GSCFA domain-containing protein [Seonamhaeicola sediminis]|uniref:GSCFA domain-containing protein n=1 Tax=Seonamhaeicola sediminis TaxID=2528206 RepID=A0A562YI79_9FLAO|nr:GSCFA domain-containing protein [Seonamhaeicola sediminis]TWO34468.1 GSCFA domain-containing protein [Seonamhaeicola sediminis]
MNLQTKIPLSKQSTNLIDYNSNILLLGSCFVENIGAKLQYFKFQSVVNPFGILFHPKAIEALVENTLQNKFYSEEYLFFNNEQWHCFDVHSKLSNTSKERLLSDLNKQISLTNKQIHESTHLIITLGTAWVYRYIKTNKIVANCHKLTQKAFDKELLSVDEIIGSLRSIVDSIRDINTSASIIFTVSPVRHLKDGFIENTLSKAHLVSAIHEFLNQKSLSGNDNLSYFPSYEIMMDELRDYRFYKEDMIHPNQTAVDYVWEKFVTVWIASHTKKTMGEVDAVQKGMLHKPFNPDSEAHKKFLKNLSKKKQQLQKQFTHISF